MGQGRQLAGSPRGKEVVNPYRREAGDPGAVTFAAKLGLLTEALIRKIWEGEVVLNDIEKEILEKAWKKMWGWTKTPQATTTYQGQKILGDRLDLIREMDSDFIESVGSKDPVINQALGLFDKIWGDTFCKIVLEAADKWIPTQKTYYFWVWLASLAREIIHPTFKIDQNQVVGEKDYPFKVSGKWVFDVPFSFNGKQAGQFDVVILPTNSPEGDQKFNLVNYLATGGKWSLVEMKLPCRPRTALKERLWIRPYDLSETLGRLGLIIIQTSLDDDPKGDNGIRISNFQLPEWIIFYYANMHQPETFGVKVDRSFVENWISRVKESLRGFSPCQDETKKTVGQIELEKLLVRLEILLKRYPENRTRKRKFKANEYEQGRLPLPVKD